VVKAERPASAAHREPHSEPARIVARVSTTCLRRTPEAFGRLRTGMSYEDVRGILGSPGKLASTSSIEGGPTVEVYRPVAK
jgi:hypothetical protein